MRLFKLLVHQKNFSGADLVINPKDFATINIGDIVEIHHPEDEFSRLLLQVQTETFREDFQQKDTISVDQTVANTFCLRTFKDVKVDVVQSKDVILDLVELVFKEQYFSRGDMWRLKKSLINTCAYLNKKVESSLMRAQIHEMWAQGEKVACGVISEDTRVVFRSLTAMVYLFIQMSYEMWQFDTNGDLYFEKAVGGFLTELFNKWKEKNINHDVTIVLFSRTFYDAQSIEDFPPYMTDCLQQDHLNRFYEDFYRIIIQNERYDDWTSILVTLKKAFNDYHDSVLKCHERPDFHVPKGKNSTAAQGNFLEVLNMSLNVFEKHYIDRNFERTGQLSVVITPGAGVFEVDRELTNVTKQRTIDNGIGSDLVCLGEQPLHAVPLFKFHNKTKTDSLDVGDDYNIPHWINYSFFTSRNQVRCSSVSFIPRIKVPLKKAKQLRDDKKNGFTQTCPKKSAENNNLPNLINYEEYDNQVFKMSASRGVRQASQTKSLERFRARPERLYSSQVARQRTPLVDLPGHKEHSSEPIAVPHSHAIGIPQKIVAEFNLQSSSLGTVNVHVRHNTFSSKDCQDLESCHPQRTIVGSAGTTIDNFRKTPLMNYRPNRALINPFSPSHMPIKLTSNRRRWVHAFPLDPSGAAMQTHHYQTGCNIRGKNNSFALPTQEAMQAAQLAVEARKQRVSLWRQDSLEICGLERIQSQDSILDLERGFLPVTCFPSNQSEISISSLVTNSEQNDHKNYRLRQTPQPRTTSGQFNKTLLWVWGVTGEQEWTPTLTTGVDWKSITLPACLPITTDYFPDKTSLENDYMVYDYSLLPDDVNSDSVHSKISDDDNLHEYQPLSTYEVYKEVVGQRLQHGFQLIILPKSTTSISSVPISSSPQYTSSIMRVRSKTEQSEEHLLSIGRIFHQIALNGQTITVTRYTPKHPYPTMFIHYRYRFQAPNSDCYEVSWIDFSHEKLENYNWNYLDHYICTQGEGEYSLNNSLKYWRTRIFVLPCNNFGTKRVQEGANHYDLYIEKTAEEIEQLQNGFIRFMEIINRIKRPANTRKPKQDLKAYDTAELVESLISEDNTIEGCSLTISSQLIDICATMKQPHIGLSFLIKQSGLPANCFISAEATAWVKMNVEGAETTAIAISLLQKLTSEHHILHASGNKKHPFIHGFYLYYIPDSTKDVSQVNIWSTTNFQNHWFEVEFDLGSECSNKFLNADLHSSTKDLKFIDLKTVNLDIDISNRSDRKEWGSARYHTTYYVNYAYELIVQWMVATGPILGELIYGWSRKAAACGLHLIPVPTDPFALSYSPNSDPLRGPIFVPLNISCIVPPDQHLFEEFIKTTHNRRLFLFQNAILEKFGFMLMAQEKGPLNFDNSPYIHVTGCSFVMIDSNKNLHGVSKSFNKDEHHQLTDKLGFLWSWNNLLTKKWRSSTTGDEAFFDKFLDDFKGFCHNKDNRLVMFWQNYQGKQSTIVDISETIID